MGAASGSAFLGGTGVLAHPRNRTDANRSESFMSVLFFLFLIIYFTDATFTFAVWFIPIGKGRNSSFDCPDK